MHSASSPTSTNAAGIVHPERFDPRGATGRLIDSEHRGRYLWASRLVAGREVLDAGCGVGYGIEILASAGAAAVTGIDIDPGAVAEARSRFGHSARAIVDGDLRDLDFDNESFDVVVCFEVIEHLERAERALAEFRRVLRPDGVLLVSSPNPDVYPAGNEHHVREYRPQELVEAVGKHFASVKSYRQQAWLASVIEPVPNGAGPISNGASPDDSESSKSCDVWRTAALETGGETYGIIVAGEEDPPALAGLAVLGDTFEVDWWSEQVREGKGAARQAVEESRKSVRIAEQGARDEIAAIEEKAREEVAAANIAAENRLKEKMAALEREALDRRREIEDRAAHAVAQATAKEAATAERLRETAAALLEANQELAQVPVLKHRLAELHEEHAHLHQRYSEIERSRSWRITNPLRRLWLVLNPRR